MARAGEVGFSRPAGSGFQRILTLSELPQHAQGSFSGLTVTGNYTQTGAAALTEQFGSPLHVNLNATLSGALNVTINPKHPPQTGAKYTALTFSSLSGEFTSVTQGFKLTTTANSIQVTKQ